MLRWIWLVSLQPGQSSTYFTIPSFVISSVYSLPFDGIAFMQSHSPRIWPMWIWWLPGLNWPVWFLCDFIGLLAGTWNCHCNIKMICTQDMSIYGSLVHTMCCPIIHTEPRKPDPSSKGVWAKGESPRLHDTLPSPSYALTLLYCLVTFSPVHHFVLTLPPQKTPCGGGVRAKWRSHAVYVDQN